jgi:hypothetical protein
MWNKSKKYILGSGLVALACRKILGNDWNIIPFGPSRFYTEKITWGDNYIVYDNIIADLINGWPFDKIPMFYKRPFSFGGQLLYNMNFINSFLEKSEIEINPISCQYFKTDFAAFNFSTTALWKYLVKQNLDNIKSFYSQHQNIKGIEFIKNDCIWLKTNDDKHEKLEYDQLISTIPFNSIADMVNIKDKCDYIPCYYYLIKDDKIDLEKSNQILVCDSVIPFNKCTRIKNGIYLIEVYKEYYENPYEIFKTVFSDSFDILTTHFINDAIPKSYKFNKKFFEEKNIILIGSNAQCDPLMDIGSCLKRVGKLINKQKIMTS